MSDNKFQPLQCINLKENKEISEKNIREFLYANPEFLGEAIDARNLRPLQQERNQPSGGILDLLFEDEDNNRYEVELQLGSTDPSHIIRSIEYWDIERKRYPKKDHICILIAENITGRFFNVISCFSRSIPMIALQLITLPLPENKIGLSVVPILDLRETDMGEELNAEKTNRSWWEEKRSNKNMMKLLDDMYAEMGDLCKGFSLNYNKAFIGLMSKNDIAKNFITFVPQKGCVLLQIYCDKNQEIAEKLSNYIDVTRKDRFYKLPFSDIKSFKDHKEDILKLVESAKERRGV